MPATLYDNFTIFGYLKQNLSRDCMGIKVTWYDDDKTILHWQYEEKWTWDEFVDANVAARRMIISVPHTVDSIVELGSKLLPEGAFSRGKQQADLTPENHGITVVVTQNSAVRIILSVLQTITSIGKKGPAYAAVSTLEDAFELIEKLRMPKNPLML